MRIGSNITLLVSGLFTPVAIMFLQDAVQTMTPWLLTMSAVVFCDLIAGIHKSLKLGVHISISKAARETMGKIVVYTAFVLTAAMLETAAKHSMRLAMWLCLVVAAFEFGSIIANIAAPMGYDISVTGLLRVLGKRSLGFNDEEAKEIIKDNTRSELRGRTDKKFNKKD